MPAPVQKSAANVKAATQIITANRLSDGVVVYLDEAGGWTSKVNDARVVEGGEALEAAVAAGKAAEGRQVVVESYAIDVAQDDHGLHPVRLREKIRAAGPTTTDHLLRPLAG